MNLYMFKEYENNEVADFPINSSIHTVFTPLLQPRNYQLSKSIVHEIK